MSTSATQPDVRWDDAALAHLHFPNFCNVASTARDFTLLFGSAEQPTREDEEVTVQLRQRVVLRPIAAKLLGQLLANTLAEHEARHGEIDAAYQALPGSGELQPAKTKPAALPLGDLPERGTLLLELIKGLGVPYDLERSCKVMRGCVLPHRFLLSVRKDALTPQAHARLPVILKRLAMPSEFAPSFRGDLERADFIHFGFEENESGCVYKAYAEFASAATADAGLLYVGYKWDPAEPARHATSHYSAQPRLSADSLRARIAESVSGPARDLCTAMLDVALSRAEAEQLLLVGVTETENARSSFDLNLYPAELQLAEIYPILLAICREYELDRHMLQQFYRELREQIFGHVSAGIGRDGREFLTIYFGGRKPRRP